MSEEETRGVKKSFTATHTCKRAYKHVSAFLRCRETQSLHCRKHVRREEDAASPRGGTRSQSRRLLNEFTAGHILLRGCYTFVTTVCALSLSFFGLLFSAERSTLHGPPAMHRNEDKRALGAAVAPVHDRLRILSGCFGSFAEWKYYSRRSHASPFRPAIEADSKREC